MKAQWNRLIGVLIVLVIGLVAFAPAGTMPSSVSPPGAAGRAAVVQNAGSPGAASLNDLIQRPDEKPLTEGPIVILPDHMDVSPPLRDIAPIAPERQEETLIRWNEMELLPGSDRPGTDAVDPNLQTWQGPIAMPSPLQNWEGINNVNGVLPPDTQGDVGPNHYIQWVNLAYAIYNKTGTLLAGPTNGNTLWSGFGGDCQTQNDGDPITLYDQLAGRWFMSQFVLNQGGTSYQCIAVSQTADPTGAWYRYSYVWPNNYLNDYPHFGLWPDAYYLTVNQFNQAGTAFTGAGVAAYERSKMLTGASAQMVYWNLGTSYGGQLPADWEGSTPPPSGAPGLILEWDDGTTTDYLRIWQAAVNWITPASSTLTLSYNLVTTNLDSDLCTATRERCIPQPGGAPNLEAISDRLMHRVQYRNFGTHQALVGNHTVDADGTGRAGIHWFELRNTGSAWAIHQQGTYAPADGIHRWMGSMAMDGAGNIALGYSASSSSVYPGIRYVGRLASDTLGALPQGETVMQAGSGSQTYSSAGRWGDYSAMQIDPADDCTFWYTQEYYQATSTANWQTRIASFKFNECGTPDFTIAAAPASQEICVGVPASFTVTIGSIVGYNNPVTLSASGNPGTAGFSTNPVTPPGNSTMSISGAVAGTYNFNVVGTAAGPLVHQAAMGLTVQAAAPSAPALTAPANGSMGGATNPTFTWNAVAGATGYEIQVATDPAFNTIVTSATGLTGTSYTPGNALTLDTVHYWRVRAVNACGGVWSTIWAFQTAASACTTYTSTDVPKTISDLTTVESTLSVPDTYNLTDVNITIGQLVHTYDADLDIYIVHPDATVVELSTDNGSLGDNYTNTVFDDEAATAITAGTAPFSGSFRPEGSLAALDGKAANGTWRLRVVDDASLDTGTLQAWSATLCGNITPVTADYSDLAGSYGIAWHTGGGALRLGSGWTADASFVEDGDNTSDDGVALAGNGNWGGGTGAFNVTASGASCLDAWMDFTDGTGVGPAAPGGADGDFGDSYAGIYERVIQNVPLVGGVNNVTFSTPAGLLGAGSNTYRFRFRLTARDGSNGCTGISYPLAGAEGGAAGPEATPTAYGVATAGEAEDYKVTFSPLAVTLADFGAVQQGDTVLVTWETVSELDNRGFNLYRGTSATGPDRQLNETLIPSQSQGNPGGFIYTWEDRAGLVPGTAYFYWLEDVDIYGTATMHGPVSVDFAVPTAVTLSGIRASPAADPDLPLVVMLLALLAGVLGIRRRRRV